MQKNISFIPLFLFVCFSVFGGLLNYNVFIGNPSDNIILASIFEDLIFNSESNKFLIIVGFFGFLSSFILINWICISFIDFIKSKLIVK